MNAMLRTIVTLLITVVAVTPVWAGPADLSRLVVIGDSLSAGFQNGWLHEVHQVNGYAALVARQAGTDLQLPLIAAPGIPNMFTLVDPGPPPIVVPAPGASTGRLDPF